MTSAEQPAPAVDLATNNGRSLPPAYVDRVENGVVLVMGGAERRTVTVWRTYDRTRWVLTDNGADVSDRRTLDGAINAALRLLGVDPRDPDIERDDERR